MFQQLGRCLVYGTVCVAAAAHGQTLKLGDTAPSIAVDEWIKGGDITSLERGKVYVIEFWATWCAPCITSIPHLSELQKKYADQDVHIIGTTKFDPNNTKQGVISFVEDQGDKMAYNVAWDGDGSIYRSYMENAQQAGIPTAFVVDRDGKLAWLGHPMAMDRPLAMIAGGKWDIEKYQKGSAIHDRAQQSFQNGDFDATIDAADELLADYPKLFGGDAQYLKVMIDRYKGEGERVIDGLDVLINDYPDYLGDNGPFFKFSSMIEYGMSERAMKLGRELVDGRFKDDPDRLAQMAWAIATTEVDGLDLNLALRAGTRANELRKGEHADTLDTLARVHFQRGDVDKAIELQARAVELETDPQRLPHFKRTLGEYRSAKDD